LCPRNFGGLGTGNNRRMEDPIKEAPVRGEERYMAVLHVIGINLGSFAMAGASVLAFFFALLRLAAAVLFFVSLDFPPIVRFFAVFQIADEPLILMLVGIVDASLLGAILLTFSFGLKSVFLGKRYKVVVFDIEDINELKEYLIGLVITLMGTRFLERTLRAEPDVSLFPIGIGVAAVILALAVYVLILKGHKDPRRGVEEWPPGNKE
jgi:uncharacterized membrane protein YqhA